MGKGDPTIDGDGDATFQQPGVGTAGSAVSAPPSYFDGAAPGQPISTPPQVIQQTVIIQAPEFGSEPMDAMCYTCQRTVTTTTKKTFNLVCCLLFGLWSCCCPGCQDVEHYCPNCKALLGRHKAV